MTSSSRSDIWRHVTTDYRDMKFAYNARRPRANVSLASSLETSDGDEFLPRRKVPSTGVIFRLYFMQ